MGGSPQGHVLPGSALLILALHVLFAQVLVRNGRLKRETFLRVGAILQIVLGGVGIVVEFLNGVILGSPFQAMEHLTMYGLFLTAGFVFLGEARGGLPKDTWRAALSAANLGVGLLFYVHSQMQMMEEHHPLESFVHWLLALACLASSAGFLTSWAAPSVSAGSLYIAIIFLIQQAMWFYFLAFALYSGYWGDMGMHLDMGDATAYFCLFGSMSAVFVAIVEYRSQLSSLPPDVSEVAASELKPFKGSAYLKVVSPDPEADVM